jgi:hypothetical protein
MCTNKHFCKSHCLVHCYDKNGKLYEHHEDYHQYEHEEGDKYSMYAPTNRKPFNPVDRDFERAGL